MGCGISREHGLDGRSTTESSHVKEEDHLPRDNGRDGFRPHPPLHAKHIPPATTSSSPPSALVHDHQRRQRHKIYVKTESPVLNLRNIIVRKKPEHADDDDHQNPGKTNGDDDDGDEEKEDDDDDTIYISNRLIGAEGSFFVGSPSFREYADIGGDKHINNGEETTPRVPPSSNEGSSWTAAALKKTRIRRSKKDSRPIWRLAADLGSLITCYHPNNNKNK